MAALRCGTWQLVWSFVAWLAFVSCHVIHVFVLLVVMGM
jgi:hypothetical protein